LHKDIPLKKLNRDDPSIKKSKIKSNFVSTAPPNPSSRGGDQKSSTGLTVFVKLPTGSISRAARPAAGKLARIRVSICRFS
jgi:hypothetical protein